MKPVLCILSCLSLQAFASQVLAVPPLTLPSFAMTPFEKNSDIKSSEKSEKAKPNKYSPCQRVSGELYGQFLYLQPNGSDLYYAAEAFPLDTSIGLPAASPNWKIFEIDPSYAPGFEVGFKVLFPYADTSIEGNWERLHTSDKDHMKTANSGFAGSDMTGPLFDIGPNSAVYYTAKGKVKFHFDEANFLFGKKIQLFNNLAIQLQAGPSFARIKQTMTTEYADFALTKSRKISTPSTFIGGGAKFDFNFDYQLCKNFFFTGESAIAILMGRSTNHTTYESSSSSQAGLGIPTPNVQKTKVADRTQVIPGFEEKLGLSYAIPFSNCSRLTFDIGYQFQIYLNAVQTVDMTAPQVLPSLATGAGVQDGVYAVGFERTLSNFILAGPYAAASIKF